jgi:hypothetical protein
MFADHDAPERATLPMSVEAAVLTPLFCLGVTDAKNMVHPRVPQFVGDHPGRWKRLAEWAPSTLCPQHHVLLLLAIMHISQTC